MSEFTPRDFRLAAVSSQLHAARNRVDAAAFEFGLGAAERYQFVCAVNEAVTNAIRYGAPDSQGHIRLMIESIGDALVCQVWDSGRFRLSAPPTDPLASHGRGIPLMRQLTDELEFDAGPNGTSVRLWKSRPAESDPR